MSIPRPWLQDFLFDAVRPAAPTDLPPLPRPVSHQEVRSVAASENHDPLILLPDGIPRKHLYLQLDTDVMPREMYIRRTVAEKLLKAQEQLPLGFSLLALDTWRTMDAQRELMRIYTAEDPQMREGSVSNADDPVLLPPHTTGGAIDLTLAFEGQGLPLGADFDEFGEVADANYFETLPASAPAADVLARDLRRLLTGVLGERGFAPYVQEWWHFSYGDQRWAAQYGHEHSLYSTIAPIQNVT